MKLFSFPNWKCNNNRNNNNKNNKTHKTAHNRSKRIIKVARQVKSNVDNGRRICEIKQGIQKKETNTSYYQRRKNNAIEYPAKVLEEYKKYYENK